MLTSAFFKQHSQSEIGDGTWQCSCSKIDSLHEGVQTRQRIYVQSTLQCKVGSFKNEITVGLKTEEKQTELSVLGEGEESGIIVLIYLGSPNIGNYV